MNSESVKGNTLYSLDYSGGGTCKSMSFKSHFKNYLNPYKVLMVLCSTNVFLVNVYLIHHDAMKANGILCISHTIKIIDTFMVKQLSL